MDSFIELCQRRRSIRKYTHQPVEQEKIDYLLRCALMSPSSKRTNPWEFVVVRDEAKWRVVVHMAVRCLRPQWRLLWWLWIRV